MIIAFQASVFPEYGNVLSLFYQKTFIGLCFVNMLITLIIEILMFIADVTSVHYTVCIFHKYLAHFLPITIISIIYYLAHY